MEPGLAPRVGDFRYSLLTLYGRNFDGGHLTTDGIDAEGNPITVPAHRHEVSLDYVRVELQLEYTISTHWDAIARIPWERKEQTAGITLIDSADEEQRSAMSRNMNLHHRSESLDGLGDLMFLGRRRRHSEGKSLSWALGITMPTGETEENPFFLGEQAIQHRHIQFGTGTVDPLLEANYARRLGEKSVTRAFGTVRSPLYENDQGFRGPTEISVGLGIGYQTNRRLTVRTEAGTYYQGYGYWDGQRDENTGLVSAHLTLGTDLRIGEALLSFDARIPVMQRTLTEGDAFEQGVSFILSVSGLFASSK